MNCKWWCDKKVPVLCDINYSTIHVIVTLGALSITVSVYDIVTVFYKSNFPFCDPFMRTIIHAVLNIQEQYLFLLHNINWPRRDDVWEVTELSREQM